MIPDNETKIKELNAYYLTSTTILLSSFHVGSLLLWVTIPQLFFNRKVVTVALCEGTCTNYNNLLRWKEDSNRGKAEREKHK